MEWCEGCQNKSVGKVVADSGIMGEVHYVVNAGKKLITTIMVWTMMIWRAIGQGPGVQ